MHMFEIKKIVENPELMDKAVGWFHSKWGIPLDAYKGSMQACLSKENIVPQWYVVVNNGRIIGGLGVIENDFHGRKDLAPNVCACGGGVPLSGNCWKDAAFCLQGYGRKGDSYPISNYRPHILL